MPRRILTLLPPQMKAPKTKTRPRPLTRRRRLGKSTGKTISSSSSAQRCFGESKSVSHFIFLPVLFLFIYLFSQSICLKYAFSTADTDRNAHGHQQHVVQSLLLGQICRVHDFSSGRQLRPKSLHNERNDVRHMHYNYRRSNHLRARTLIQDPYLMHNRTLFHRNQ